MDIRDVLKAQIDEKGLKQCAVARKAGMRESQLSAILSKRRKLAIDEMFTICRLIDVKPDELYALAQQDIHA